MYGVLKTIHMTIKFLPRHDGTEFRRHGRSFHERKLSIGRGWRQRDVAVPRCRCGGGVGAAVVLVLREGAGEARDGLTDELHAAADGVARRAQ